MGKTPGRQGRDRHRRGVGHRQGDGRAVPQRGRDGRRRRHRRRRRIVRCRRRQRRRRAGADRPGRGREHGGLDIIFANAGISGGFASISEQSAEDWAEILRVNLIGPFLAIKHAAPHLKARGGGSIICTASVAGLRSGAGGAAYSASKAGVINLVQTAAQQLSGTGIRVNAICPGLIETGMTKPIYDMAREQGPGPPHRRAEPAAAAAASRARSPRPRCSSPRTNRATSTARPGGRRRPVEQPPDDAPLRHSHALERRG